MVVRIRKTNAERLAAAAVSDAQQAVDEKNLADLKEVTGLATLIELNQSQIDQYHKIATGQADRSFRSAQRAMWIGLLILTACFIAGLFVTPAEARIFIGSLAALGTTLSGFLNRTYLKMYSQAVGQLDRYFDQPVLTGYYLTAERLAQNIQSDPEGKMRELIISEVLKGSGRLSGLHIDRADQEAFSLNGAKSMKRPVAQDRFPKDGKPTSGDG